MLILERKNNIIPIMAMIHSKLLKSEVNDHEAYVMVNHFFILQANMPHCITTRHKIQIHSQLLFINMGIGCKLDHPVFCANFCQKWLYENPAYFARWVSSYHVSPDAKFLWNANMQFKIRCDLGKKANLKQTMNLELIAYRNIWKYNHRPLK